MIVTLAPSGLLHASPTAVTAHTSFPRMRPGESPSDLRSSMEMCTSLKGPRLQPKTMFAYAGCLCFRETQNKDDLDIRGTLHCLSFTTYDPGSNSDTSADRGIVIDEWSISYTSLDTKGGYLSMDMPEVHEHNYTDESEQATRWDEGQLYVYCLTCGYKKTNRTIYPASQISISKKSFTWTGSMKTPSVTVKDSNGKALKKNTDYKVTYSNNKNVGKAHCQSDAERQLLRM